MHRRVLPPNELLLLAWPLEPSNSRDWGSSEAETISPGPHNPDVPIGCAGDVCLFSHEMNLPFFNRLQLKKVTVGTDDEMGKRSKEVIEGLLTDLPDLLMACVVNIQSGRVLASYTVNNSYNPNQISLRNAKILRIMDDALAAKAWVGGPLTDVSVMLEDQLHHLRPMNDGKWYCFLAVHTADANLGIAKEIMRRHTLMY